MNVHYRTTLSSYNSPAARARLALMNLRKFSIKIKLNPTVTDPRAISWWLLLATNSVYENKCGRELKCSSFSSSSHTYTQICVLEKSWFYSILFYQLVVRWRSISIDIRTKDSSQTLLYSSYMYIETHIYMLLVKNWWILFLRGLWTNIDYNY